MQSSVVKLGRCDPCTLMLFCLLSGNHLANTVPIHMPFLHPHPFSSTATSGRRWGALLKRYHKPLLSAQDLYPNSSDPLSGDYLRLWGSGDLQGECSVRKDINPRLFESVGYLGDVFGATVTFLSQAILTIQTDLVEVVYKLHQVHGLQAPAHHSHSFLYSVH